MKHWFYKYTAVFLVALLIVPHGAATSLASSVASGSSAIDGAGSQSPEAAGSAFQTDGRDSGTIADTAQGENAAEHTEGGGQPDTEAKPDGSAAGVETAGSSDGTLKPDGAGGGDSSTGSGETGDSERPEDGKETSGSEGGTEKAPGDASAGSSGGTESQPDGSEAETGGGTESSPDVGGSQPDESGSGAGDETSGGSNETRPGESVAGDPADGADKETEPTREESVSDNTVSGGGKEEPVSGNTAPDGSISKEIDSGGSLSGNSVLTNTKEDILKELTSKLSVMLPMDFSFNIDLYNISGKGQIYSEDFCFQNFSNVDVRITFDSITCELATESQIRPLNSPEEMDRDSGEKLIYLHLEQQNGKAEERDATEQNEDGESETGMGIETEEIIIEEEISTEEEMPTEEAQEGQAAETEQVKTGIVITEQAQEEAYSFLLPADPDAATNKVIFHMTGAVNELSDLDWYSGEVKIRANFSIEPLVDEKLLEIMAKNRMEANASKGTPSNASKDSESGKTGGSGQHTGEDGKETSASKEETSAKDPSAETSSKEEAAQEIPSTVTPTQENESSAGESESTGQEPAEETSAEGASESGSAGGTSTEEESSEEELPQEEPSAEASSEEETVVEEALGVEEADPPDVLPAEASLDG